jgi:DNA-binding NtrC family response regulator
VPEVADLSKTEQKGLLLLSNKADKYDVRLVCATARELPMLAATGQFDEVLLQALSGTSLRVPSLAEHREDIPDLAKAMAVLVVEGGEANYREFDVAALNALRNANWSGNLAQLDNVVRNLMLTCLGDKIALADVTRVLEQFSALEPLPVAGMNTQAFDFDRPLREARDVFESLYFEYHIAKAGGNMSKVAEAVGVERTHLYRKLKQLNIRTKE